MTTAGLVAANREALHALNQGAQQDLLALWNELLRLYPGDPVAVREALEELLPALVGRHAEVAAMTAEQWYLSTGADSFTTISAPPPSTRQVVQSAKWSVQPLFDGLAAEALARLSGAVQKYVYNSARDTVIHNAVREGTTWARVARPDGCAFCRMLASRGFAYVSLRPEDGAGLSHEHCRCQVVAKRGEFKNSRDLPNYDLFQRQYYAARADIESTDDPGARELILARMRGTAKLPEGGKLLPKPTG